MLQYKNTCYSWTKFFTDNKIDRRGRDLFGTQFKYLFSFLLGLPAPIPPWTLNWLRVRVGNENIRRRIFLVLPLVLELGTNVTISSLHFSEFGLEQTLPSKPVRLKEIDPCQGQLSSFLSFRLCCGFCSVSLCSLTWNTTKPDSSFFGNGYGTMADPPIFCWKQKGWCRQQ